jgi:Phosphotransferase enzyme family
VAGPGDQALAWAAQAVAPGARVTRAAGLREGGNPWLLRLERAGTRYRAVLKTGDPASARDRRQLRTQVAALALAHEHSLPVPRVINFAAWRRSAGTTALLDRAERQISERPVPAGATVLVHGDLWQGTTMWSRGACTGVIDWDAPAAGPPGIDLGTLRLDAAPDHGPGTASHILDAWRQATGHEPEHVAYWDVLAGRHARSGR